MDWRPAGFNHHHPEKSHQHFPLITDLEVSDKRESASMKLIGSLSNNDGDDNDNATKH